MTITPSSDVASEDVSVTTVDEFRQVLRSVKEDSGLTFAQLGAKIGTSRQLVHKMTSVSQGAYLPGRYCVLRFLDACAVAEDRKSQILQIWQRLEDSHAR